MHNTKGGLAVGHYQLDVRVLFRRVVGIRAVELFAAHARLDDVPKGGERLVCEILRADRVSHGAIHDGIRVVSLVLSNAYLTQLR